MTYLAIIFSVVFINNILLSNLIGLPIFNKETKLKDLVVEGLKTVVVGIITIAIIYPIYRFLLVPEAMEYLVLLFVVIFGALVSILLNKLMVQYKLKEESKDYSLLSTASVVVIVAGLLITNTSDITFLASIATVLGLTLGHLLITVLMFVIQPKINLPGVPKAFKGLPLMLITIGLIAMVFMGLNGIL